MFKKIIIFLSLQLLMIISVDALNCICKVPTSARIVGGNEAKPNDYPWMASIGLRFSTDKKFPHFCGGTILNSRWILTAAHCVRVFPFLLEILLGAHSLKDYSKSNLYTVKEIIKHPGYSGPKTHINDIAVLKLSRDIQMGPTVQPGCISSTEFDYSRGLKMSGWGALKRFTDGPDALHEVDLKFVEKSKCFDYWKNFFVDNTTRVLENAICASEEGKDACNGDSGGPLMSVQGGKMYVNGVVSKGYFCRTKKPVICESVAAKADWIQRNVGPVCNV